MFFFLSLEVLQLDDGVHAIMWLPLCDWKSQDHTALLGSISQWDTLGDL